MSTSYKSAKKRHRIAKKSNRNISKNSFLDKISNYNHCSTGFSEKQIALQKNAY